MVNEIKRLDNGDFEVFPLTNIPQPTNPSEFERLKPVNTYKKIREMEENIKTVTNLVNQLQLQLNNLKETFLKGE